MPENVGSSVADETDATRRQRDQIAGILQAYERV
jgi:Spy/CpxP family protein refolding chaperone